jgi:hypothetical protein
VAQLVNMKMPDPGFLRVLFHSEDEAPGREEPRERFAQNRFWRQFGEVRLHFRYRSSEP